MSTSTPFEGVRLEFYSRSENVAFARAAAAVFASRLDFTLDEIEEIKVATSEAVSNAVVHGYPHRPGLIRLILDVEGGALVVTVEDDGVGIDDVQWAQEPAHTTVPEERMGLGLVFIHEYMNDVQIRSKPGHGTQLRMVKRPLHATNPPSGGPRSGASIRH